MIRKSITLALAAAAALAGCDRDNTLTQRGPDDPMADTLANAAPVELPPAIQASKSYRCSGDNSVIYVDWLSNGAARVKASRDEVGTEILPGTDLTGDANAASISYKGKSCKA